LEEEVINKGYLDQLELTEVLALPFYVFLIVALAYIYQMRKVRTNPSYKFFARGILAKMIGGAVFCFVYVYYYNGGDTIAYFESARSYSKLFLLRPYDFTKAYFESASYETYNLFDNSTGFPQGYIFFEGRTLFVVKMIVPIVLLGFNSYLISTLILSVLSFIGIWNMYQVLCKYYPSLNRILAIGFIFFPSAIFWGSGILKDTISFSAVCWLISSFEKGFISKVKVPKNLIIVLISGYIIIFVKPYIFMAAVPGLIVWLLHARVIRIRSNLWRYLSIPIIYVLSIGVGVGVMSALGDRMKQFSLNKVLETASITQKDLKNADYQGHSFDVGSYDGTVSGVTSKLPVAIIAGLFRPFIWESKNVVMILSGLENLILLILFIRPFIKIGVRKIFSILFKEPLLLFLFSYSLLFAFSIGVSTSNFGALIRFKIAFAPFFASLLLVLLNYDKLVVFRKKQLAKEMLTREREAKNKSSRWQPQPVV